MEYSLSHDKRNSSQWNDPSPTKYAQSSMHKYGNLEISWQRIPNNVVILFSQFEYPWILKEIAANRSLSSYWMTSNNKK